MAAIGRMTFASDRQIFRAGGSEFMRQLHQSQFVLTSVVAIKPGLLSVSFADGYQGSVDISESIDRLRALAPLRSWELFKKVSVDECSRGVVFGDSDDLHLAGDNLRAKSLRQAGHFSHEDIVVWMSRHGMTLDQAAKALGLSRRMLAYYRSGEKPVPRTVGLALLGWETIARPKHRHARGRPAPVGRAADR
ncbi:DUF2442 domain-containing protein [Luteibacter sp.]|uniref:DUF2442 domain-containing protein n=1 Tax=Luteibacter sp. TaxID=1886636 RepID=UPI003F81C656